MNYLNKGSKLNDCFRTHTKEIKEEALKTDEIYQHVVKLDRNKKLLCATTRNDEKEIKEIRRNIFK